MTESIREILKNLATDQFWRTANLTERVLLGPLAPQVRTPAQVVFLWERSKLLHYTPMNKTSGPPVLIIPPLMVQPTIFDLRAGHSFVRYLMDRGNDVYLLDLGVPDKNYVEMGLDDYIFDFIEPAFEKVLEISGSDRLFQYGWSMGGIMSYIFASFLEDQSKMAGLITCGSPVDFSKMFPFHILAKVLNLPLFGVVNIIGNIPPILIRTSFRAISPITTLLRYGELAANYHDREWVQAFESIDDWVDGFIPYPKETFKQFVNDCIIEDKLRTGDLEIGDKQVDLKNLTCPFLAILGETDKLAPAQSVEDVVDLVGSNDVTLLRVPMGHIGMVAGQRAPEQVWKPLADWISKHR